MQSSNVFAKIFGIKLNDLDETYQDITLCQKGLSFLYCGDEKPPVHFMVVFHVCTLQSTSQQM